MQWRVLRHRIREQGYPRYQWGNPHLEVRKMTAVGFEPPTPLRTGALSQRPRPLGQTVVQMGDSRRLKKDDVRNPRSLHARKNMTTVGLEPTIFGSEDRRHIH